MKMSVNRVIHIDAAAAVERATPEMISEALTLAVERAREYVAKDTWSLHDSIQKLNKNTYGVIASRLAARNKRDYSGYQEGIWPTHTKYTPYMEPSAADVEREFPAIVKRSLKKVGL